MAELAVRPSPLALRTPANGAAPDPPDTIALLLVDLRELGLPEGGELIRRRLPTTHAVASPSEARRIVGLYRMRRAIEQFFRTLETAGFDIADAAIRDRR